MRTMRISADFIAIIGLGLVLLVIFLAEVFRSRYGHRKGPANTRTFTRPIATDETAPAVAHRG